RQTRSRKVVKGLLTFSDSYGLYDVFQKQIDRMERQLKPYVTETGYNEGHFFHVEVNQGTPMHKKLLILRPKHTPHLTRPNLLRSIGFSHGGNDSQYLPKLKERLLSEDEHDPNQHFASSMPTLEMLNGDEFEEEDEEDLDEADTGLYGDISGLLSLAN